VRQAARLLFLVLVAVGVAGMHTTGHPSAAAHDVRVTGGPHVRMADASTVSMAVARPGPQASGGTSSPAHPYPLQACVALRHEPGIMALTSAARMAAPAGTVQADSVLHRYPVLRRAPPPRPIGLTVADLSVIRT
jgi:hypothetical protein